MNPRTAHEGTRSARTIGGVETVDVATLDAHLARLDLRLRRAVRTWELANQDPGDDYRGLYIPPAEVAALLDRPFAHSWGQQVELPADEEMLYRDAIDLAATAIDQLAADAAAAGALPRLLQVAAAFELDEVELEILLLALAPAMDAKYERIYGYLQDNVMRRRPSVRLVLDLLGDSGARKFDLGYALHPEAPLFRHRLLELIVEPPPADANWINRTLHIDETVAAWLRGEYVPSGALAGRVTLEDPVLGDAELMLAGEVPPAAGAQDGTYPPIVALYGDDLLRHDAAAAIYAATCGRPLLTVDLKTAANEQTPAAEVVRLALRDARLTGAVAYLRQWDACLDEDRRTTSGVLAAACAHPGPIVLSSAAVWQPGGVERARPICWHACGLPGYPERVRIWRHYLAAAGYTVEPNLIAAVAAQFALASGRIRDAVAAVRDQAGAGVPTAEQILAAARAYSNPRLSALARKLEPRFGWGDIILPENQLAILYELVSTVRHRPKVLEQWGVGEKLASSAGVAVLFAGPPGTGKTMAAEVIAADLGLDLYKIDLSSVVSKYIGETEKNLERIFGEASSSNAILFFDEADAIFGKRSEVKDAHDRYANVEISYLLQRMERYDGITILATNLRANLDEAFTRRLQFAVDFPFPRVEERRRIWTALFPPGVPRAEGLDFDLLARRYELAGGSIRNIIVSAAYLAANNGNCVTMEHLAHGAKRELQKMGRLVSESDYAVPGSRL